MSTLFDQSFKNVDLSRLDPNKPVFFCDVDGVINHLNYIEKWIGEGAPSDLDFIFKSRDKWAIEKIEIKDPDKQFAPDAATEVKLNRLASLPESDPKYKTIHLGWNKELAERVSNLSKKANFIWLTTWKSEAIRLLNPLWDIDSVGYLEWNTNSDLGATLKWHTVTQFFEDINYAQMDKPAWVWVEDDYIANRVALELSDKPDESPHLIIRPNSVWGIDKREIHLIEQFVAENTI